MDQTTRWETEALRGGRRPQVSQKRPDRETSGDMTRSRWVTLREAASVVDVPIGTVRSWAKTDAVPSYIELDSTNALRMVDLDSVKDRAEMLGRVPRLSEPTADSQQPTAPEPPAPATPDTMIVPIDAWNKMLNQLGNLHEAGQQLAAARERAARAETEAEFLRERLKELREQDLRSAEQNVASSPIETAVPNTEEAAASRSSSGGRFVRYVSRRWRGFRAPRS